MDTTSIMESTSNATTSSYDDDGLVVPDYCSDPSADVSKASLWDIVRPCPHLLHTVPTIVGLQFVVLISAAYIKRWAMYKAGISQQDINVIFSSRRRKDNKVRPNDEDDQPHQHHDDHDHTVASDFFKDVEVSDNDGDDVECSIESRSDEDVEDGELQEEQDEEHDDDDDQEEDLDSKKKKKETTSSMSSGGFDITQLVERYGDRKLRILDSLSRKGIHFIMFILGHVHLQLTVYTFKAQGQSAFFCALCVALIHVFFLNFLQDSWFCTMLFGASARIRDGNKGRLNFCVSTCVTTTGFLATYFVGFLRIIPHVENPDLQMFITVLFYTPLVIGDALGELIGGPLGGTCFKTFQVKGFGEINRKSVEGCTAVFLGSLFGCLFASVRHGATATDWYILCFNLAVVTTIVETISFRSTDNFFIPVCNSIVVYMALGPLGYMFGQ